MNLWRRFDRWWHTTLNRQLVLPIAVVTVIGMLLVGAIVMETMQRILERQAVNQNATLALSGADTIGKTFQDLINLSRLQQVQMLDTEVPETQIQALQALQQYYPDAFSAMYLLDDQQRTLAVFDRNSSTVGNTPQLVTPLQPFQSTPEIEDAVANQRLYVSPVNYETITETPFVTMTIPLITSTQEGMLVVKVDARFFWQRVDTMDVQYGNAMIVDNQGVILAHPDRQQIGQQVESELQTIVLSGLTGSSVYEHIGTPFLASYAPIPGLLSWGVVIEQNRSQLLAPVNAAGYTILLIIVICALTIIGFMSLLIRRITKPVAYISEQATQITMHDDLSPKLEIQRYDEIGTLALSLNTMVANLRAAHAEVRQGNERLEQEVSERTLELQDALAEIQARSKQQAKLLALVRQLSMPIIPITAEIVVVPLVGDVSEDRAQELLITLLREIQQQHVLVAILDITGVPMIEPNVARRFVDLAYGARLIGASIILAGIRPDIAQVLVSLGADLKQMRTVATLDQGFDLAKEYVTYGAKATRL